MSNCKYLFVTTSLTCGGAERALYNLITGLPNDSKVLILSLTPGGHYCNKLQSDGFEVLFLDVGFLSLLKKNNLSKLLRVIKFKADIIQGWMYHGNLISSFFYLINFRSCRLFWSIRQSLVSLWCEKKLTIFVILLNSFFSFFPNKIIFNSKRSINDHSKIFLKNKNFEYIANGIDIDYFCPNLKPIQEIDSLPLTKNSKIFLHVARYHPMKGHDLFIYTAVRLLANNRDLFFILVGREIPISILTNMTNYEPWMFNNFIFLGERNDLANVYNSVDYFCLTSSRGEAFPNALAEAMSCNVYCISSDVGDAHFILGDLGSMFDVSDRDSLYFTCQDVLASKTKHIYSDLCRERIVNNFSIQCLIDNFLRIYK